MGIIMTPIIIFIKKTRENLDKASNVAKGGAS